MQHRNETQCKLRVRALFVLKHERLATVDLSLSLGIGPFEFDSFACFIANAYEISVAYSLHAGMPKSL
jgi:hypothetical protein